jgi:hypothetical protein
MHVEDTLFTEGVALNDDKLVEDPEEEDDDEP